MSNPIFEPFNTQRNQQPVPQGIFGMINQVRNSPNPTAAMEQLCQSNPALSNVMQYVRQNGGDAKTAFYNMAAAKGVDPNYILRMLS